MSHLQKKPHTSTDFTSGWDFTPLNLATFCHLYLGSGIFSPGTTALFLQANARSHHNHTTTPLSILHIISQKIKNKIKTPQAGRSCSRNVGRGQLQLLAQHSPACKIFQRACSPLVEWGFKTYAEERHCFNLRTRMGLFLAAAGLILQVLQVPGQQPPAPLGVAWSRWPPREEPARCHSNSSRTPASLLNNLLSRGSGCFCCFGLGQGWGRGLAALLPALRSLGMLRHRGAAQRCFRFRSLTLVPDKKKQEIPSCFWFHFPWRRLDTFEDVRHLRHPERDTSGVIPAPEAEPPAGERHN